jgi:hypothetical protein
MLVNVYAEPHRAVPFAGTRLLPDAFGIMGVQIEDPKNARRIWCVQSVYAPIPGRMLGGVRIKLVDTKGFITFCNQRDMEVILGLGEPGHWCQWAGEEYVGPEDRRWMGLCADEDDLIDDLFEKEMYFRSQVQGGILVPPIDFVRRIHTEPLSDLEEFYMLLGDYDPETGFYPDNRLETIERRWARSHRDKVRWDRI